MSGVIHTLLQFAGTIAGSCCLLCSISVNSGGHQSLDIPRNHRRIVSHGAGEYLFRRIGSFVDSAFAGVSL